MARDFFDPTPEQQNVTLIDAATLSKAERLIESCEPATRKTRPARLATADEIAESIVFLANDHSSFVYGVNLAVDGGRTAV